MMNKFWNGRAAGLPGAMLLILVRIWDFILDKLTTAFVSMNLSKCGKGTIIRRGFQYRNPKNIEIGDKVEIGKNVIFSTELEHGRIIIEEGVTIGRNCKIDFSGLLIIKSGTLLSEGVNIQTHDHGLDPKSKPHGKELIIEENCWIGLNVTILSNANHIRSGSIIGANSLVTRPISDKGIYIGSPIKRLNK